MIDVGVKNRALLIVDPRAVVAMACERMDDEARIVLNLAGGGQITFFASIQELEALIDAIAAEHDGVGVEDVRRWKRRIGITA